MGLMDALITQEKNGTWILTYRGSRRAEGLADEEDARKLLWELAEGLPIAYWTWSALKESPKTKKMIEADEYGPSAVR